MAKNLEEVNYPDKNNGPEKQFDEDPCPECGTQTLIYTSIPCPDGEAGCLVNHMGYVCSSCFKTFQQV